MSEVIRTAMAEMGVFAENVPNAYRIQDVFGTSRSYCSRCNRVWSSHISWVKFDLRSQRVLKNWRQRCLGCSQEVNPFITAEELERMAILAIQRCQALTDGTFRPRNYSRKTAPHRTTTCEKCKYGRRPCWLTKQKPGSAHAKASYSPNPALINGMVADDIAMAMASLSVSNTQTSPPDTPPFSPSESPLLSPAVSPPMLPSPGVTHHPFTIFPPPSAAMPPSFYDYQHFGGHPFHGRLQSF